MKYYGIKEHLLLYSVSLLLVRPAQHLSRSMAADVGLIYDKFAVLGGKGKRTHCSKRPLDNQIRRAV